jgi:hypothetical protein
MPKPLKLKAENQLNQFLSLVDLVVLSNTLANKLGKAKDFDHIFGGELKMSANNFAKKLETALRMIQDKTEILSEDNYDMFENLEKALLSFMDKSWEQRLSEQIDYGDLKNMEEAPSSQTSR